MKKILPLLILIVVAFAPQAEAQQGPRAKLKAHKVLNEFFKAAAEGKILDMEKNMYPLNWGTRDSLPWLKDPDMLQPMLKAFRSNSADDLIVMKFSQKPSVPSWVRDSLFVIGYAIKDLEAEDRIVAKEASIFLGPSIGNIIPETPIPQGVVIEVETTYLQAGQQKTFPYSRIMFETYMEMAEKAKSKNMQLVLIPIRKTPRGFLIFPGSGL